MIRKVSGRARFVKYIIAEKANQIYTTTNNSKRPHTESEGSHNERTIEYYRSFNWVAEATIENCDITTSRMLAQASVRSAVDFLRLIIGHDYSYKFGIATSRQERGVGFHFAMDTDGGTFIEMGGDSIMELSFKNELAHILADPDETFFMEQARTVLRGAVTPNCKWPLTLRFLDALYWYGEAVTEKQVAASFVKYILCIERLLMTEEKENITTRLIERGSALGMPAHLRSLELRNELRKKIKRTYDLRSKIVHGAISPDDAKITLGLKECGDLAERILKMYLVAFRPAQLTDPTYRPTRLAKWFDDLDRLLEHLS